MYRRELLLCRYSLCVLHHDHALACMIIESLTKELPLLVLLSLCPAPCTVGQKVITPSVHLQLSSRLPSVLSLLDHHLR